MTSACVPVLRKNQLHGCDEWLKKVLVQDYDPSNKPIGEKRAATLGMSMTEKQGGSDVRSNTTMATPIDATKRGAGTQQMFCQGFI